MTTPTDNADNDARLPEFDLRLTEESVEALYEHAPCGYCSCLPDGTFVKLNRTLLDWLGYDRGELVAHKSLQELLSTGGQIHYETFFVPMLLLQGRVRELSYQLLRKDGSMLPVLLSATLVRDTNREPLVSRITLFDITDRRRYEEELLRAKTEAETQRTLLAQTNEELTASNRQLTRLNAELDNFVYTASHDLKQPIDNMTGLLRELKRTATFNDPEAEHMLRMFDGALQQIQGTIHDLTEVVQLQRTLDKIPAEKIELKPFVEAIIRGLHPPGSAPEAQFELDFSPMPHVLMVRPVLHSILQNLLSNALKYRHPDRLPRVRVTSLPVEECVMLTVADNGLGLDLERHGREMFQLFRRFHPQVPGSGTGLYLVNRLVHQFSGRIEVNSTVGKGTRFRVFLPQTTA